MRGMVSKPSSETTLPLFFSLKLFPNFTILSPQEQTNEPERRGGGGK